MVRCVLMLDVGNQGRCRGPKFLSRLIQCGGKGLYRKPDEGRTHAQDSREPDTPGTELESGSIGAHRVMQGPLAALLEWQAMAEGAYSPNTSVLRKRTGHLPGLCESRDGLGTCRRIRNDQGLHRGSNPGRQEARDGQTLCRDDRARAHGGGATHPAPVRREVGLEEK